MNEIETALIVLSFVIIIIVIILYLYEKQGKLNRKSPIDSPIIYSPIDSPIESFANYQDVKTKTENWCNKMLKVGLLTPEQFNSCISTFQDATSGVLPKEFKTPNTGMSRNFSLYDNTTKELTSNVTGENTNIIMLVNNDGFYMACDKNNNVYFIKDINETTVNQQEIYFNLIPQTNNVYMIMSSYGKYLIINSGPNVGDSTIPEGTSSRQDWCASFTGKSMGPMTNWKVTVLESNANGNGNKASFQSAQLTNFFLSSVQNDQDSSLVVNYGNDDTNSWSLIPKSTTNSNSESVIHNGIEYIVAKELLLKKIADVKGQKICVQAIKDSLNKLQILVRTNFTNIKNHMEKLLNYGTQNTAPNVKKSSFENTKEAFITSSQRREQEEAQRREEEENYAEYGFRNDQYQGQNLGDYQDQTRAIQEAEAAKYEIKLKSALAEQEAINKSIAAAKLTAEKAAKAAELAAIQAIAGTVINSIVNMKNNYLQTINADIGSINTILDDLQKQESEVDTDYGIFLNDLNTKSSETKFAIAQNNEIMDRQKSKYDKLNGVFSTVEQKKEEAEKMDEIAKINTDLIGKTSDNNSNLVVIYPLVIFILTMCLIYLIYITYKKFMVTIYLQYSQ